MRECRAVIQRGSQPAGEMNWEKSDEAQQRCMQCPESDMI